MGLACLTIIYIYHKKYLFMEENDMKKAVLSMVLVLTVAFPVIGCAQKPASSTNLEHQQKAAETAQAEEP